MKHFFLILFLLLSFASGLVMAAAEAPSGLMTDLLERTDQVWRDGFLTTVALSEIPTAVERLQYPVIRSKYPTFSWIVNDSRNNVLQTACEIEVASKPELLEGKPKLEPDYWKSGQIKGEQSTSVLYCGKPLQSKKVYYWHVRTWNNDQVSPWSEIKSFIMASELQDYNVSRYPVVKSREFPESKKELDKKTTFYDFGKASFAQIKIDIIAQGENRRAFVRLGERVKDGKIDRNPAGSTRYAEYELMLRPGVETWFIKTRIDKRNSSGAAVLVDDYIGEVMPFRYAEIEVSHSDVAVTAVERETAAYVFNDRASFFDCDNEVLNQVWDLCHYSIKATSFLGVFIDGDRERIPYEGDALLNQLSHYSVDREYSLSRYSQNYMIFRPTWPTEWILQSVQMAWYDYLYTGDSRNIKKFYNEFRAKSLLALADDNGLISTLKGKMTRKVLDSIHFSGKEIRDIVDWPHKGLAGNENAESGETDGFVFCDYNAVVNAYHYFALRSMTEFAKILDQKEDIQIFSNQTEKMKKSFQKVFFDAKRGIYKDGDTTDHTSLHSNMFALAFGLVPPEHVKTVTAFVQSRGMKCSVYGAQFLLDALYEGDNGEEAFKRMTAEDKRGWFNMLKSGSTISMEAWDDQYKPNQDWNHAWGAAPANIIPRKLVGVEPLEPAFKKIRIKPQIADLKTVRATVPTIRGPVHINIDKKPNAIYLMTIQIPANITTELYLPFSSEKDTITVNGKKASENKIEFERNGKYWKCSNFGSGQWSIQIN